MSSSKNVDELKKLSTSLMSEALSKIQTQRQGCSSAGEEYIISAEYLLLEAEEYVEGAWEMVSSERYNASLALSRWILEASLNLFWAVANRYETKEKIKVLAGEALRCDANLREGLAELWTGHAKDFKGNAEEARQVRKCLGVDKPKSLEKRLKDIKQEDNPKWPELYPLYRICCAAAHPSLKVWERFVYSGNSTVTREPIDKCEIACWMVAASTLYLVTFTYCLTELGDSKQLKDWWEKKVRPLLNGD